MKTQNPYLVFSSVDAERTTLLEGLGSAERNFDLAVCVYNGEARDLRDEKIDFCYEKNGYKFQNFYEFSKNWDISEYKAIWLVDEDVMMSAAAVNTMFDIFSNHALMLAQPAYDRPFNWDMCLVDNRYRLRYTNFVENGAALLSRAAVTLCMESMRLSRSGWGLDFIWPKLCGFPPRGIGIIDEVILECPPLPSALEKTSTRQEREAEGRELMREFDAEFFVPRVLGGIRHPEERTENHD